MSSQIMKSRKQYYEILEKTQKGSICITDWICWFLYSLQLAILASETILADVIKIHEFWQKNIQIIFNHRQKLILNIFLNDFVGNLTSAKWAKICKCSQDTASRDINDLLEKNILEKVGLAKNTYYILRYHEISISKPRDF